MKNYGLKERQRQINIRVKEEERRIADLNMNKIEKLENQSRINQQQIKYALAQEYEQTISEKRQRRLHDAINKAEIDRRQLDIGTRLSMHKSEKELQRKMLEKEYYTSNFNVYNLS
jgi:hypothetical protein